MTRIALISIVTLSFSLGCPFRAIAQPRNAQPEHWQAVDKSMTDLLLEGYRPVSVIAPSSHLRVYFLSSGSFLAKCTEEAKPARLPPPPGQVPPPDPQPSLPPLGASGQQPASTQLPRLAQGAAASGPGNFTPEIQVNFECSRLSR